MGSDVKQSEGTGGRRRFTTGVASLLVGVYARAGAGREWEVTSGEPRSIL
jgi:hypothetical protein